PGRHARFHSKGTRMPPSRLNRRGFTVLAAAAATWPFAARAQQGQRMRRVGVLLPAVADDAEFQTWLAAFYQALALLGWTIGRNVTGFMTAEFSMGGKRLELLKQVAPRVTRVAVLRDPTQGSGTGEFAAIQALAPSLRIEVSPVNMRDAGEIERAVETFARAP